MEIGRVRIQRCTGVARRDDAEGKTIISRMRLREAHVPVVLWVCAAMLMHLGGSVEADRVAEFHEGKVRLRTAARTLIASGGAVEVDFDFAPLHGSDEAPEKVALDSKDAPTAAHDKLVERNDKKVDKKVEEPIKEPVKPPVPDDPKNKAAEKKVDLKIALPKPATPPIAVAPPPPMPQDAKKISIQQQQERDEEANRQARFLAEKNHHVKQADETHATITSLHQNHPEPTPGTHAGPISEKPGNSERDVVAHDEDRPGVVAAPNVVPKELAPKDVNHPPAKTAEPAAGDNSKIALAPQPPDRSGGTGLSGPQVSTPSPDVAASPGGTGFTVPSASDPVASSGAGASGANGNGRPKLPELITPGPRKWTGSLAYGGSGTLAIPRAIARAAIGSDELDRLKTVEAQTRLSQHRGAWRSSSLQRWRAAIENYTPGVKPGNQTNLGTAAVPWATYLVQIHVRLHPIFADSFVDSLHDLPASHPLNDMKLVTRMEIVLRPDGTLHHPGIVRPSGVTAFDVAALDAVDRASPFGKAPEKIISPDGLVYLHWEFHRGDMRCSNVNAFPYLLKEGSPPKPMEPTEPPPTLPTLEGEKTYGMLLPRPGQLGFFR